MLLKRAALNRLNARLANKKEELQAPLRTTAIDIEDLEPSTLSAEEKYHISRWLQGAESGRACLLAVLDHRRQVAVAESDGAAADASVGQRGGEGMEISLMSSSVNLPESAFRDSSYLFKRVFSKPPVAVIREALELLREKAHEQTVESLDVDQINMALKQIRIDNLAKAAVWEQEAEAAAASPDEAVADQENQAANNNNARAEAADAEEETTHTVKVKARMRHVKDEEFRLQIIVELIRLHVLATNPADPAGSPVELTLPSLPERILASDVQTHLAVPLERQERRALTMPPEELERSNTLLKPYIHQLAALRGTLQAQLKELEENAAFFSLGLDSGSRASHAQIKRAYHALAVRLHPDKPGGDTAKFQALQDAYQEVLKKKREKDAADAAVNDKLASGGGGADAGDAATAQHIVELVAAGVAVVRQAAAQTTSLAQRNLRLMKDVEAAACESVGLRGGSATALRRLKAILLAESSGAAAGRAAAAGGGGGGSDDDDSSIDSNDSDASLKRWMRQMDKREPKLSIARDGVDSGGGDGHHPATPPTAAAAAAAAALVAEAEQEAAAAAAAASARHDLEALSAKHAVPALEAVCEHLQLMAAKAMELPACGGRYALATARNAAFIAGVEKCMSTGLASLKTTGALSLADTQVSSSVLRLKLAPQSPPRFRRSRAGRKVGRRANAGDRNSDSDSGSSDEYSDFDDESSQESGSSDDTDAREEDEFRGILVEMVVTAFRSASVTINIAAERAIAAVVTATDLHLALVDIVSTADRERQDDARRRADADEAEGQFCAEDQEMMREMRSKAAADERAKSDVARAQAKAEDEKKRQAEDAEDAEDPTGFKALGRLKSQIQSLQVQLHLQHVKTLHALNAEARGLQAQLLAKMHAACGHAAGTGAGGGAGGGATSHKQGAAPEVGAVGTGAGPGASAAGGSGGADTVVALVADLVDASYAELRLAPLGLGDAGSDSGSGSGAEGVLREIRAHLGWMVMTADGGELERERERVSAEDASAEAQAQADARGKEQEQEQEQEQGVEETKGKSGACENADELPMPPAPPTKEQEREAVASASASASASAPPPESAPAPAPAPAAAAAAPALALLPDYRTRALLMAVMLQGEAARALVHVELRERLVGLAGVTVAGPPQERAAAVAAANAFIDAVLASAETTRVA